MKWISVKDRLPEHGEVCLTCSSEIDGNNYRLIRANL